METIVRQTLISVNFSKVAISPSSRPLAMASSSSSSPPISSFGPRLLRSGGLRSSQAAAAPKHSTCHHRVVMRENAAGGYAEALAEAGQAGKNLEAIAADMEKLGNYLDDPDFFGFLSNPIMLNESKKKVLKDVAADAEFQDFTLNLLYILIDRRRANLLKLVVRDFQEIYDVITDTEVATVTSAIKLESPQLALIAKKIQSLSGSKNVRLKNVIDPTVIAGFVIRFGKDGSRQVDLSVKRQLEMISSQINVSDQAVPA